MTTWTRPCACGVDVTANPNDPTPGVAAHIAAPEHQAWRRQLETFIPLQADLWPYSPGVLAGRLVRTQQVPDNGGVSQPHIEDLDVSLPDPRVVA